MFRNLHDAPEGYSSVLISTPITSYDDEFDYIGYNVGVNVGANDGTVDLYGPLNVDGLVDGSLDDVVNIDVDGSVEPTTNSSHDPSAPNPVLTRICWML